jgi:hypothetical protein
MHARALFLMHARVALPQQHKQQSKTYNHPTTIIIITSHAPFPIIVDLGRLHAGGAGGQTTHENENDCERMVRGHRAAADPAAAAHDCLPENS